MRVSPKGKNRRIDWKHRQGAREEKDEGIGSGRHSDRRKRRRRRNIFVVGIGIREGNGRERRF